MARNANAIAELDSLLPLMEEGSRYTNPDVFKIAQDNGIHAGYSTVSRWLSEQAEGGAIIKHQRGLWERPVPKITPVATQGTQGILPLEVLGDPFSRQILLTLARIESKMDDVLAKLERESA